MQKQKKREEQLRKWREREMSESSSTIESFDKSQRLSMPKKETRVKFPKGCVFLAACSSGDIDEVRATQDRREHKHDEHRRVDGAAPGVHRREPRHGAVPGRARRRP